MTEHRISLDDLARKWYDAPHSIFGASSSHMWLACSGSLIPNILAPDDSGIEAAYGTVAHGVTEHWLTTSQRPDFLIGTMETVGKWVITIDEEMLDYVEQSVDRCEWMPGDHLVERRVNFSHLTPIPNQGGTLDFAAMRRHVADVTDHKYGSSPENIVYAEENPQGMLYAVGLDQEFGLEYNFKDFIIRINQPILNHFDEWNVSHRRLMEFSAYVRERATAAWQLNAPRTPGQKQCRFCKVRGTCSANAKLQEDLITAAFMEGRPQTVEEMATFIRRLDDDAEPFSMAGIAFGDLTTAQMAKLLPFRNMAENWWKALEEELNKRAWRGEKVPGMKLVEGRSHRQFVDDEKAREALFWLGVSESKMFKQTFVSPNQAEELLREEGYRRKDLPELLRGLVRKPPGRATLVPVSDKRNELQDLSAVAFGPDAESVTRESDDI